MTIEDYAIERDGYIDIDVTDMTILNQPCKFKWSGYSKELSTLNCDDSNGQTKRNIKLWRKSTSGSGAGKTFTFYGLTTPQDAAYLAYDANNSSFEFDFKVGAEDNTLDMILDGGWEISFRIHNASSSIEQSLKFDIRLLGNPPILFTQHLFR